MKYDADAENALQLSQKAVIGECASIASLSQVDIVKVTDPGGPSFQPNVAQTIDKQFSPYKSFNSPQMEEAIKDLHPKQQQYYVVECTRLLKYS